MEVGAFSWHPVKIRCSTYRFSASSPSVAARPETLNAPSTFLGRNLNNRATCFSVMPVKSTEHLSDLVSCKLPTNQPSCAATGPAPPDATFTDFDAFRAKVRKRGCIGVVQGLSTIHESGRPVSTGHEAVAVLLARLTIRPCNMCRAAGTVRGQLSQ